jgi:hypothetical protein
VGGFEEFVNQCKLPPVVSVAMEKELLELGAVDIHELGPADWEASSSWQLLKPLEQPRAMCYLQRLL